MKVNYLSIWALFVLSLVMFTSCEKLDVDETMIEEEEVITEVVTCNLEVLIGEQPPGSGDLFAVATGGATPYTYSWSTGAVTANITGAEAGTYTVTVTDAEGCTAENEIIVSEPDPCESLTIEIEETAAGILVTNISGGTTPYAYTWSNGATTSSITVTTAGTYTLTVTDAEGCTTEQNVTTTGVDPCLSLTTEIEETAAGILVANTSGGTTPYVYTWSNGEMTSSITVTAAGTYTVTVTDAVGCTVEQDVTTIGFDPCLSLTMEIEENPAGNLTANTAGGATPYTYSWSTDEATSSISVAAGGLYSLTVTDANGCTVVDNILAIGLDPCLSFTVLIAEQPPGSGDLFTAPSGGVFPFTYVWSTGETTPNISVTTGGAYSVTITDSAGCTTEDDIQL